MVGPPLSRREFAMAVLTEEQSMLKDAAKAWTQEKAPVAVLRRIRDKGVMDGWDRDLWAEVGQMGWTGVLAPEEHGGSAFGYKALGLILEETGRTLAPVPLLSTALIGSAALTLGGTQAQKAAWLPKIAAGEIVTALALEESAHHAPEMVKLRAHEEGGRWFLEGAKTFVMEGFSADLYVVAARTRGEPGDPHGLTLFLVEAKAKGLSRRRLHTIDSRGWADVIFNRVDVGPEAVLGEVNGGFELLEDILDRARVGLAAEMLGSAVQAFEVTLDYLKTRTQFGQVIGTFQALQHRAAKMFTELELARSCVEAALDAIDARSNDVRALASLAKAKAGDAFHLVSNEMVQMHGGIGMTDAADAGLYLKRARVAEAAFGNSSYHRDRYAKLSGF
jgi:alkylation response protein AidB-like acyl-CoA dehydrogenase